jgi:hypothetical protein
MGRHFQGWILLVVFVYSGAAGMAGIYSRLGRQLNGCPICCCGRADCPMHKHGQGMPGRCPMASIPGHDHQAMSCACTVSPPQSSPFPVGPLDLRYDLPRVSLLIDLPAFARERLESRISSLDGFFPLPELPPKALLH